MKLFYIKMIVFNIVMYFMLGYPSYKMSEPNEKSTIMWLFILYGTASTLVTGIIPLYKEIKNEKRNN